MAIGDLYELTHVQELVGSGERIMSKWHYAAVDILSTATSLYQAWTAPDGMLEAINALQCPPLLNRIVRVVNLFSLTDFYEDAPGGGGIFGSGNMLPIHSAYAFSLKLDTRGVRPGSKRISGGSEAMQDAGVWTDATTIGELNALATKMTLDVIDDNLSHYDPVVIKRILDPNPTPLGSSPVYRMPVDQEEADYGHVVAALLNIRVSHQVSRGNGR